MAKFMEQDEKLQLLKMKVGFGGLSLKNMKPFHWLCMMLLAMGFHD